MVIRKPIRIWCIRSQMGFMYLLKFIEEESWWSSVGLSFDRFWFRYQDQVTNGFYNLMFQNPTIGQTNILGIRVIDFYPMYRLDRDMLMSRLGDYLYHVAQGVNSDD
jgi:hypothetical protein